MIKEKSLVLYKNHCAVVAEAQDKLTIVLANGDRLKVREKDVELLHEGPSSAASAVVAAQSPEGDPREAWELLQGNEVELRELAELAYGEWTPITAWAAWTLVADGLLFQGSPRSIRARDEAAVSSEEAKRREKEKEAEERQSFLDRLNKGVVNLPEDGRRLQDIEALALGKTDRSKTLKDLGRKETPEEAHKLLLSTAFWTERINPHPSRFGRDLFSAKIAVPPPPEEERVDLTHLKAFAIDNAWSSDPDDAVSVDGKDLWVHVADPAASIPADSPVDLEARARGSTLYIPEGTYRMVAEESLDHFALGLSETSPALSFKVTLGEETTIQAVEIVKSVVKVTRLTYEEADARANERELAPLFQMAALLEQKRIAEGAVTIELPEVHIVAREETTSIDLLAPSRASAAVREFMLIAGQAAARYAIRSRIPFPFVTQELGDLPAEVLPGLAGSYQLRRCMRPRRLSAMPGPHEGLGLPEYCQVTSPLRRYTDLVAHQQLRRHLGGETLLTQDQILERIAAGEIAAQTATQAERASKLHWTLAYLSARKDEVWNAVVVEKKGGRGTVLIPALGLETAIAIKGDPALNEEIQVMAATLRFPTLEYTFTQV